MGSTTSSVSSSMRTGRPSASMRRAVTKMMRLRSIFWSRSERKRRPASGTSPRSGILSYTFWTSSRTKPPRAFGSSAEVSSCRLCCVRNSTASRTVVSRKSIFGMMMRFELGCYRFGSADPAARGDHFGSVATSLDPPRQPFPRLLHHPQHPAAGLVVGRGVEFGPLQVHLPAPRCCTRRR